MCTLAHDERSLAKLLSFVVTKSEEKSNKNEFVVVLPAIYTKVRLIHSVTPAARGSHPGQLCATIFLSSPEDKKNLHSWRPAFLPVAFFTRSAKVSFQIVCRLCFCFPCAETSDKFYNSSHCYPNVCGKLRHSSQQFRQHSK